MSTAIFGYHQFKTVNLSENCKRILKFQAPFDSSVS